jgi:large subunit ribosomal protein L25
MERSELTATVRLESKKGAARRLRRASLIPAVLYGARTKNVLLSLDPRALLTAVDTEAGMNTLIHLQIESGSDRSGKVVMLRELQVDPVSRVPLHADLYEIRMDQAITVSIPLRLVGKAAGIEEGGILDQGLRELRVECLPGKIPEVVEADVSALNMGDSIHVSDLVLPESVKVLEDETTTVASVSAPAAEEEAPAPAEAEGEVPAAEEGAPEAAEAPAAGEAPGEGKAEPAEAKGEKGEKK